jgi:hypothetical protein
VASIPTDARVNHSRTVVASVVDGHGVHGADSHRAAFSLCLAEVR